MAIITIQGAAEKAAGIYYEVDTSLPPLGKGGMGAVMRGVRVDQRTGIRTEVAIKFLYEDLPANAIERARREASIQIHNENLVEMFGFIEIMMPDQAGRMRPRYHVASELLNGVMLYDLLQGKTTDSQGRDMPFAQELFRQYSDDRQRFAVTIVKNLLSGLMALHDAGWVHRDIDPSNIMITSNGKIKLIDFGIAKKLEPAAAGPRQQLTSAGQFMGKAAYAAPELVLGDVDHENETTDIYAVGILLFELLTGHVPFLGTIQEVAGMQLKEKVPVSEVDSKPLQRIIARATAKKQGDRYQSASEFRVAIEQLGRTTSSGLSKPDISISMPKMPKIEMPKVKMPKIPKIPKKVWIGLGAAAVLAVLIVVGVSMGKKAAANAEARRLAEAEQARNDSIALANYKLTLVDSIVDSTSPKPVIDERSGMELTTVGMLYNNALAQLASPETAAQGIEQLQAIIDKGYASSMPAMVTMSKIYMRDKTLDEQVLAATGEVVGNSPNYAKAHDVNLAIIAADDKYYPAMFELGNDFFAGPNRGFASSDISTAISYYERGLALAQEKNDSAYVIKFNYRLDELK